jgi:hypothetical protein
MRVMLAGSWRHTPCKGSGGGRTHHASFGTRRVHGLAAWPGSRRRGHGAGAGTGVPRGGPSGRRAADRGVPSVRHPCSGRVPALGRAARRSRAAGQPRVAARCREVRHRQGRAADHVRRVLDPCGDSRLSGAVVPHRAARHDAFGAPCTARLSSRGRRECERARAKERHAARSLRDALAGPRPSSNVWSSGWRDTSLRPKRWQ